MGQFQNLAKWKNRVAGGPNESVAPAADHAG
jgi:hypothetical protein